MRGFVRFHVDKSSVRQHSTFDQDNKSSGTGNWTHQNTLPPKKDSEQLEWKIEGTSLKGNLLRRTNTSLKSRNKLNSLDADNIQWDIRYEINHSEVAGICEIDAWCTYQKGTTTATSPTDRSAIPTFGRVRIYFGLLQWFPASVAAEGYHVDVGCVSVMLFCASYCRSCSVGCERRNITWYVCALPSCCFVVVVAGFY